MKTHLSSSPRWSTASFGEPADTSPMELSALGQHLNRCQGARGRLFALQCAADSMTGFVAPRFITTLALLAVVTGIVSLVW